MKRLVSYLMLTILLVSLNPGEIRANESPPAIDWVRQFGTAGDDFARSVSVDSTGKIIVTGYTNAAFPSQAYFGGNDIFLRMYDSSGSEIWTRQFGTPGEDSGRSVSVYSPDEIYLAGHSSRDGSDDVLVRKYDSAGSDLWTRQFGTSGNDHSQTSSVDSVGNIFVAGYVGGGLPGQVYFGGTYDAFLRKYDAAGNELWTRQFGTSGNDLIHYSAPVDSWDNVYVAGYTEGALPGHASLGGYDGFLKKFDSDGNELWTIQFGTPNKDIIDSMALDNSGNVYALGYTSGTFPGESNLGSDDIFLGKWDSEGNQLWIRQFGTSSVDVSSSVGVDASGDIYVAGYVEGALPGQVFLGGRSDCFVKKFDTDGNDLWTYQFGTSAWDVSAGLFIANTDTLYLVGHTDGNLLGETGLGGNDAFLMKFVGFDNEGPVGAQVAADPNPAGINAPLTVTATISDVDTGGSTIASAEYSVDGGAFSPMDVVGAAFDEVEEAVTAGIPAFSLAGVHDICVRGTDLAGNIGAEECVLLAVYDPDAGFVTGGGWIDSLAGAYTADPALTGKANFGFVSKYKKGTTIPTGQTEFQFRAGDLNFHSSSYQWLVVAGPNAKFKGEGTINGTGNYGFMLTATDSQVNGGGDVDKFRIKIWDKDIGDAVVYDNKMGTDDDSYDGTPIGGGNVVIHKAK